MADPRALLDSNICIYVLEGLSEPARSRIESYEPGEVVTSAIAYAEVMRGLDPRDKMAVAKTDALFAVVPVLPFEQKAALAYRSVPFRRGGFDRLIAAHALSLGLVLVTSNVLDFQRVAGLRVEDWTRP